MVGSAYAVVVPRTIASLDNNTGNINPTGTAGYQRLLAANDGVVSGE